MSILNRKLLRDLAKAKWQYIAIGTMVVLGVMFFNAAYAAYVNLYSSYQSSYKSLHFEDFGVTFNAAPSRVVERIRRIPGIAAAEGRLVEDVALELPSAAKKKKLVGRFISIPTDRTPRVDQLKLLRGTLLHSSTRREILLEASFAKYHSLKPGGEVIAVWGSSRVPLRIAGIVQSDEYLYVVRSKQELMAVPDTFGVMFVSPDVLGSLVGKSDQINDIRATVADPSRLQPIMRLTTSALNAYKPQDPVARVDQPSYQMLMQDVNGFQAYAVMFPAFFLSVAAVAVYTLLLRMVHQQRPVIGLLRSLGFSRGAVVRHYLGIALVVGLISSIGGTITGVLMARWTSASYMGQLQVPVIEIIPRLPVLIGGVLIGVATCGFAGLFPARMASKIKPAEAMRPVMPTFGKGSVQLDRLIPHARLLWRIPLRNVFRQPKRTLSTVFGVIAGVALMMTAKGLLDSSEVAIDQLVSGSYKYDLRLDFIRAQSHSVVSRVQSWPGVLRAEGVLELPVDMRHGTKTYSGMISGQQSGSLLHTLKDANGRQVRPVAGAAIFGQTLKKRLDLEIGDLVEITVPEQFTKENSTKRQVRVCGFAEEAIGTIAYMRQQDLGSLFRKDMELPPNPISGVVVRAATNYQPEVRDRLYDMTDAGSVLSVPEIRALIGNMLNTMRSFVWIMELFGAALAFAMVFNMVTINVLERSSEVATLRTIGVSRRQVAWMIGAENMIVALVGVALGLPIGRVFVEQFWKASQTPEQEDLFTFTMIILPETYVIAALAILIVALVSQFPSLRFINRINLAQATKERSL